MPSPDTAVAEAEQAIAAAEEALGRFEVDALVAHLSTAIRAFTAAGDPCRAAMACVQLGQTYENALGNLTAARAWYVRASRLVADVPDCLEQGWVAVAAMGCDVDDPAQLLASAELALDRARRFGDVNLETKALADGGLALVQAGRVTEGMALLDEAMALACGPADRPDTAAKSVCSFFTACCYAAEFDRADTWSPLLRQRGLIGHAPGHQVFLSSHCDSVQATALMELGRWGDAERVLERSREEFAAAMPIRGFHADIALADLRIRQGRLTDAEQLLLGMEQSLQALRPAARLHLARGDHDLARAAALRGLRAVAEDRLRAAELLTILVDAEVGRGELDAASAACAQLAARMTELSVPALHARAAAARGRVLAARGDVTDAVVVLEEAVDRLSSSELPVMRMTLLVELARQREAAGDRAGATLDAAAAAALGSTLDVTLAPADRALLDRLAPAGRSARTAPTNHTATLELVGRGWIVSAGGTTARLQDTKGVRYLAALVARPGTEQHALDLVDRVEGLSADGLDRRALGDAGPALDTRARVAYRRRIEELRTDIDDALAAERLETAERLQDEVDQLVRQLAHAFGLGGRERSAASAAERARLNVTRAIRTAIGKVVEVLPSAGAVLDRRVRTGLYCAYEPAPEDDVRWTVNPGVRPGVRPGVQCGVNGSVGS